MSLLRKRPDWSRRLPQPLTIPGIMTLTSHADFRVLIDKHMPKEFRDKSTRRHVRQPLADAAAGACEPSEEFMALQLVLSPEGVPCRPGR